MPQADIEALAASKMVCTRFVSEKVMFEVDDCSCLGIQGVSTQRYC